MADDAPTTGQRVHAGLANLGTDTTISAPAATPELIATGLAQIGAGSTVDYKAPAGGTLDLPESDRVSAAGQLDPGQLIGRFVIRSRLGEGGMGVVLAGHDADLARPVAIKVVKEHADHPGYRARLLREAQVMARLEHPNVVRVYEVGTDRGRLFVAMELVDGVTLWQWLKVQRRGWREILAMFQQVGAGLAAVHRSGLVHRDFKPDNVLVDRDGHARVADFGLARLDPDRTTVSPELAASLTRTGMMVGTPAYMAPEQHFGGNVDARADQYSFCVSLREALIGSRPIKIEDKHWGDVPRPVRTAIERGANVDVNARWESMTELLAALAKGASRRKLYLAVAAAGIILVGGGIGAATVLASSSSQPTKQIVEAPVVVPADAAPAPTPPPIVIAEETQPVTPVDEPAKQPAKVDKPPPAPKPAPAPAGGSATRASNTTRIGNTTITPMAPLAETPAAKRHAELGDKEKLHEMPAAHRPAVRAALADVGFLGITITGDDREADLRELETQLAAATDDLKRGAITYGMGHAERARDNCSAAMKHWSEARKLVMPATKDLSNKQAHDTGFLFFGRIRVGEMYCELMAGRALGVAEKLQNAMISMWAAKERERAEVHLAWGIAAYETGDEQNGKELLVLAAQKGSDKVRAAVSAYAAAVGIKF